MQKQEQIKNYQQLEMYAADIDFAWLQDQIDSSPSVNLCQFVGGYKQQF